MATIQELIGYLEQMKSGKSLVTIQIPLPREPPPKTVYVNGVGWTEPAVYLQSVMIDRDVLLAELQPLFLPHPDWDKNKNLPSRPVTHEEYKRLLDQWEQFKQQSFYSDFPSLPKDLPPSLSDSGSENDAQS